MPACDHCGRVVSQVVNYPNGHISLRLCPMCQAEMQLRQSDLLSPGQLTSTPLPWWKRLWRKMKGQS